MKERIILVAKNFDEFKEFKELKKLKGLKVYEIEDIRGDFQEWVVENNISDKEMVYLLVHFGQIGTEDGLCEKIKEWKINLKKENVTILPISKGARIKKALELREKVINGEIKKAKDLELYISHWKKECESLPIKKIIGKWMSFFVDCETIRKKYKTIEEMNKKLTDGLIKIMKDEKEVNEMDKKYGTGTLKDTWNQLMKLLDKNKELKEDEFDKFIKKKEWKEIYKRL